MPLVSRIVPALLEIPTSETGLYYYRARYYHPEIGRFLQIDPIGYLGGINLYTYCLNDPVNWIDPWGLKTYRCRRQIGRSTAVPISKRVAHEFTFTGKAGAIKHTYGWGNSLRREQIWHLRKTGDWRKDHPNDMTAAEEALRKGMAVEVGDDSLDYYVERAFREMVIYDKRHSWWPWDQCQTENKDLLDKARELELQDQETEKDS